MDILRLRYKKLLSEVRTDIHRFIYNTIDWSQPLIGIKGQRGVGKTTIMLQRLTRLGNPPFMSLSTIYGLLNTL